MTEEELEIQIQSYAVEDAFLPLIESGRHAKDYAALAAITSEHERKIGSTFQFRLPQAWRKTKGRGVRIALLDTGVDSSHPDLKSSIVESKDFTGQGIEDANGHGSQCAGIIAAKPEGMGLWGLAPESKLLIGKVINDQNQGDLSNIADGVDWAVDYGAHIICMSMCEPSPSPLLYRSIAYALAKGVHVICAANISESLQNRHYSSHHNGSITVAAHDGSSASSPNSKSDFTTSGQKVWSTYKEGSYRELVGCSAATSIVTGIAALAVSRHLSMPYPNEPIFNCDDLRAHLVTLAKASSNSQLPSFLSTVD